MTIATTAKNNFINGQAFDAVSLHSTFPGTTGAGELSGSGYARLPFTVAEATGGSRSATGSYAFNVPVCTARWLGFLNEGLFLFGLPNGGAAPKNFAVAPDTDIVWSTSHGWSDGQKITFFQGMPPSPLVEGTTYFVRDATTHGFKVTATLAGLAIDLTTGASDGCWMAAISETEYVVPSTHLLTAATFVVRD